jgi:NDP-sugar pyrophosphorylase family protein
MLPVGDRPLLGHLLDWLHDEGVCEVAINLHHAPEAITSYVGNGNEFGLNVTYSHEPALLGTAGAAKKLAWFLDEPFVVVYGDGYLDVRLGPLQEAHRAGVDRHAGQPGLTMLLFRVPNPSECGLVEVNEQGDVVRFVEKPPVEEVFTDLANAGLYYCDPEILELIPPETVCDFGKNLIPLMLERGDPVMALPISSQEYVIDIGTPAAYQRAQEMAAIKATGKTTKKSMVHQQLSPVFTDFAPIDIGNETR